MNKKRPGNSRQAKGTDRHNRNHHINHHQNQKPGAVRSRPSARPGQGRGEAIGFRFVERSTEVQEEVAVVQEIGPFRVLIAVHRPRFRGRAERAAALEGWDVTALLNKQDPVGQVAKPPRPPDLLVLSGDFGRQRDYAIFRAVQRWRSQGMKLIGLVEDCETAPEGYPDSAPGKMCDVCLPPPYRAADLRALFSQLYEEIRGEPAPSPQSKASEDEDEEESQ